MRRTVLALLLSAASFSSSPVQAQSKSAALGVCPASSGRLDSYIQALCDGEAALQAGRPTAALERFRFAATLSRIDATNELAWAGLAAAHCRRHDLASAQPWTAHFAQARGLWLGELDCEARETDVRGRLSPFVRSRMCGERLIADYALMQRNPTAPYALDLRGRLDHIAEALAQSCATGASPATAGAALRDAKPPARKAKTGKKSTKRKPAKAPVRKRLAR